MSLKIAWVDDEIPKLENHVRTLELLGHSVQGFQRTKDFLEWLNKAKANSVDTFFVDLMMKIDDESLDSLSQLAKELPSGDFDTGILLIKAIRKKFPDKPIVAVTVVSKPPTEVFSSDKKIMFIHKVARIRPALSSAMKLLKD